MIIIKPNGGLGNRMRTVHSGILLGKLLKQNQIKILWKNDPGLNAAFNELFKPIPFCIIIEKLWVSAINFYGSKLLFGYRFYDDQTTREHVNDLTFWSNQPNKILMNTCKDFLNLAEFGNFYDLFIPVDELADPISKISSEFNNNTFGVHIRRTDKQLSIINSKTGDFINAIQEIISVNENAKFYLTTDDLQTENQLSQLFGDKIIKQDQKDLSRNSISGVKSAVIDMFCLSKTKAVLGSYTSSFGEVASQLGKIPFIAVRRGHTNNLNS